MVSINVYCVDDDSSFDYRLRWPAEVLKAQGADIEIVNTGVESRDADVCVFNRPVRALQAEAIEMLAASGRQVIVDVDDNYDSLASSHSLFGKLNPEYLHRACEAASVVTVTTLALEKLYGYGHGVVIPNHIPAWYLEAEPVNKPPTLVVGWTGTLRAHPEDLQVTGGGIARALKGVPNSRFAYIGAKHEAQDVAKALRIRNGVGGWGWFDDRRLFMSALACIDVGIVPLQDSCFNQGKSWLKGLEFAAVGVPFVASPTEDYCRLGVGLLARQPNEWQRHVTNLLKSEDLRAEVAAKGRERASQLTIEANIERWGLVWGCC